MGLNIVGQLVNKTALIKGKDEHGPIRYMNPDEIKDRVELNVKNTTESLRARVLTELAKSNGHSDKQRR